MVNACGWPVYCSWFGRKRKTTKCSSASGADSQDVAVYEEVVRLPAFTRKTLVLLGKSTTSTDLGILWSVEANYVAGAVVRHTDETEQVALLSQKGRAMLCVCQ